MFVAQVGEVYAPHALPMYREEINSKKRKERSDRKDPVRSKKPDPPVRNNSQLVITSAASRYPYVTLVNSYKARLNYAPRSSKLSENGNAWMSEMEIRSYL